MLHCGNKLAIKRRGMVLVWSLFSTQLSVYLDIAITNYVAHNKTLNIPFDGGDAGARFDQCFARVKTFLFVTSKHRLWFMWLKGNNRVVVYTVKLGCYRRKWHPRFFSVLLGKACRIINLSEVARFKMQVVSAVVTHCHRRNFESRNRNWESNWSPELITLHFATGGCFEFRKRSVGKDSV